MKLAKAPYRIYIGRGSRVLTYTVWTYRVLNSGYKAKKPSPILLKPIHFNTYKSKSNGRARDGERKFLFRFRHPTYEWKHFQPLSKVKNTQGRTSCFEVSNTTCTLLHWSIVPTFKRRQMRKIHTSNDKTNACHVTEAATHTLAPLHSLHYLFALQASRWIWPAARWWRWERGLDCHTLQVKIKFVLMWNREMGLSLAVKWTELAWPRTEPTCSRLYVLPSTPRQLYPLHIAHYTTAHPGPRVASQPGQIVGSYKDVGSMSTWEPWINRSYLQETLHQIFIARILTYLRERRLQIHFRRLSSGWLLYQEASLSRDVLPSLTIYLWLFLQCTVFTKLLLSISQIQKLARNTQRLTLAPLQETFRRYFLLRYSLRNTISQPHLIAKLTDDALRGRSKKSPSSIGTGITL